MNNIVFAALEIGTTTTRLALGTQTADKRLQVLAIEEIPSAKIRKGQILSIDAAERSVTSVIRRLKDRRREETGAEMHIGSVCLALNGPYIKVESFPAMVPVASGIVTKEDTEAALNLIYNSPIDENVEEISVYPTGYMLNNLENIDSPIGMTTDSLTLNALRLLVDANRFADIRNVLGKSQLDLQEAVFGAIAASLAATTPEERADGVLTLDLGGGSTGFCLHAHNRLIDAGNLGVGGDHICTDMSWAFKVTHAQAMGLLQKEAGALLNHKIDESERINIAGESPLLQTRTISRRSLNLVVHSRLKELFSILNDVLKDKMLLNELHSIVLTGGVASLPGIAELAQTVFNIPTRIGNELNVDGFGERPHPEAYASLVGTLIHAMANTEPEESSFFGRLFGALLK